MSRRREAACFAAALAVLVAGFFAESLCGGKILSPADVLLVSASFCEIGPANYEPGNRLLMDPVLQFEPWIEFNRRMLRSGRLPLWNSASGCGAPHLANGQSAVFDPFLLIAYFGSVPAAYGRMGAARLWFAGLGMFFLGRAWGMQRWGRWFTGLAFPFSGFLVSWMLYPVTNAAIWLPWTLLATDAAWRRPSRRRTGALALTVGGTLLGGHVQTAAHVLLATAAYAAWLAWDSRRVDRRALCWGAGILLGMGLAAVEVVPLGAYLTRSPVWTDRDQERLAPWKFARPRLAEMACTALPSIYGSQRRGEPNLAKAVGADNQNESAGGYAGLATLVWLAPLAWSTRSSNRRVGFLAGLTIFGWFAAFRLPPVDNLLRIVPVLKVTDNRRLTLWVAFGLVALGGYGLDHLVAIRGSRAWRTWGWCWALIAVGFLATAMTVRATEPWLRGKALEHYTRAAQLTTGADPIEFRERAERQVAATLAFVPLYHGLVAAEWLILAGLMAAYQSGRVGITAARVGLVGLTLAELARFGVGLNPAIEPALYRPVTPLIAELQARTAGRGRVLGLGAEFPPNSLMRYGLADPRNYDSVELSRNLDWFRPIYDPAVMAQTSRREVTWDRIGVARDRLSQAGVCAIVGATPPPPGFRCLGISRHERAWIAWGDSEPLIAVHGPGRLVRGGGGDGRFEAEVDAEGAATLVVLETKDPGWTATMDGRPCPVGSHLGTFLSVSIPPGRHLVTLQYDPVEVRLALIITGIAAFGVVFALTGLPDLRSTRSVVPRLGRTQALGLESDS